MAYFVVRVRGNVGVRSDIEETMRRLRLTRVNHIVIVPKTETIEGMLKKAKDFITWGEAEKDTIKEILLKRGEWVGGGKIDENSVKEKLSMTIDQLVEKIYSDKIKIHNFVKPFRAHPPRGGYRSTKRSFKEGGSLGYRGEKINDLVRRMI